MERVKILVEVDLDTDSESREEAVAEVLEAISDALIDGQMVAADEDAVLRVAEIPAARPQASTPALRMKFPIGCRVSTTLAGWLLKGQIERRGYVVGYSKDPACVRVQWDGWRGKSSQAVCESNSVRLA